MNNVLSTRVTIFRNLKDYKFEPKLMPEKKQEIVDKLSLALKGKMSLLTLNQADVKVVSFLKSNDLVLGATQNLFVSKNKNLAINLFCGEHISIVSTCEGFKDEVINNACEISQSLNNKINFAFSDEFGYLMSDLNKIGSGIKIESNIMLSAIKTINKIEQLQQNISKLGYTLKETKYPAVYTLSTRCNLGIGEKKLFEDFKNTLSKIQDLEIESVKMLDVTNHDELLDKVNRSVAIINSAHLLSYDELYNLIVNIRMGVNAGLIDFKVETINRLQKLISGKQNDLVSQSELKALAEKTKEILKGEENV